MISSTSITKDNCNFNINKNNINFENNHTFNFLNNTTNNHSYHNNESNGTKVITVKIAILKRMSMRIKLNDFLLKESIKS